MNRCYDLHTHTHLSDGSLSPKELVNAAAAAGVQVLALTDHDTTAGLEETAVLAAEHDIEFVPGVEISATWSGRTVHIVGLQIDPANETLQQGLKGLVAIRHERAATMIQKLVKKGFDSIEEELHNHVAGPIVSRTHFARALVSTGQARDIPQAFKKFLSGGKAGYAQTEWASLEQAVEWIRVAGGHAVIAHPGRYKLGSGRLRALFAEFAEIGGEAVEVISGSQHPDETEKISRFAREFQLMASVGSDYHGPEQRWLSLGRLPKLPAQCDPIWRQWLDKKNVDS